MRHGAMRRWLRLKCFQLLSIYTAPHTAIGRMKAVGRVMCFRECDFRDLYDFDEASGRSAILTPRDGDTH